MTSNTFFSFFLERGLSHFQNFNERIDQSPEEIHRMQWIHQCEFRGFVQTSTKFKQYFDEEQDYFPKTVHHEHYDGKRYDKICDLGKESHPFQSPTIPSANIYHNSVPLSHDSGGVHTTQMLKDSFVNECVQSMVMYSLNVITNPAMKKFTQAINCIVGFVWARSASIKGSR